MSTDDSTAHGYCKGASGYYEPVDQHDGWGNFPSTGDNCRPPPTEACDCMEEDEGSEGSCYNRHQRGDLPGAPWAVK